MKVKCIICTHAKTIPDDYERLIEMDEEFIFHFVCEECIEKELTRVARMNAAIYN